VLPADLLARLARDFAANIQHLLNATICDGVRIATVVSADPNIVLAGSDLGRPTLLSEPFPVRFGRAKPSCWLDVSFRLCLDDSHRYLTVVSSFFGIFAPDVGHTPLCHFDYERDKQGGYPEAHLQINGESPALAAMTGRLAGRPLIRLHFPVGGRRYRPILEDVIEFLIVERLARPRDGWADVLSHERERYYSIQLQAAVRRQPEIARRALDSLDAAPKPRSPAKKGRER
jgi:hypothetical protein